MGRCVNLLNLLGAKIPCACLASAGSLYDSVKRALYLTLQCYNRTLVDPGIDRINRAAPDVMVKVKVELR